MSKSLKICILKKYYNISQDSIDSNSISYLYMLFYSIKLIDFIIAEKLFDRFDLSPDEDVDFKAPISSNEGTTKLIREFFFFFSIGNLSNKLQERLMPRTRREIIE